MTFEKDFDWMYKRFIANLPLDLRDYYTTWWKSLCKAEDKRIEDVIDKKIKYHLSEEDRLNKVENWNNSIVDELNMNLNKINALEELKKELNINV